MSLPECDYLTLSPKWAGGTKTKRYAMKQMRSIQLADASDSAKLIPDSVANPIPDRDFQLIRKMIYDEAGISLSDAKRTLVCSRLSKRLRLLKLQTHSQYLDYLANRDPGGVERQIMINCLTTNKTDFFREPHHFDFLREQVYPRLEQAALHGASRRLRIWSAACSSGEEPYTIAMTILEHFSSLRNWEVEIVASDINTEVLQKAREGIYSLDRIEGLDIELKRKYFLRGKGRLEGSCQVIPEIRKLITFRQVNFMEKSWPIDGSFDVIFCRNVLIYFNSETQQKLLPRLTSKLVHGGYLMLGHSENLPWLAETMMPLGQTIHQKAPESKAHASRNSRKREATTNSTIEPLVPKGNAGSLGCHIEMGRPPKISRSTALHSRTLCRTEITAGQVLASKTPIEIATTLGSCVAACLYDPVAKVGGMNHFMLPIHATDEKVCGRYGVHAMELLINEIAKLGGDRRRLRAKAFGGSSVIALRDSSVKVGQINATFIRKFFADENIPLEGEKLGGDNPLRVYFLPSSGTAYVKQVTRTQAVTESEVTFMKRVSALAVKPSEALLF